MVDHGGEENSSKSSLTGLALSVSAMALIILLAVPFIHPAEGTKIPRFVLFLGRFHPMILHFPIGWIFFASLTELLRLNFLRNWVPPVSAGLSRLLWFLAMASALVTILLGWMLSLSGGYDPGMIKTHLTEGVITGIGSTLVFAQLFLPEVGGGALRWGTILATLVAMTLAGHIGASITHGPDYLTEYAPAPIRALMGAGKATGDKANKTESTALPVDSKAIFTGQILPALTTNCVSCHGPTKRKGGLRLDSYEAVMKGGEDGPVIVPGDPAKSELLRRINLPLEDEDHMAPKGKPQMTATNIATLSDWIKAGAIPDPAP